MMTNVTKLTPREMGQRAAEALLKKANKKKQEPVEPTQTITNVNVDTDALVDALTILSENQLDLTPIVEALGDLPSVDLTPVIDAINGLDLTSTVNVDLQSVVSELKKLSAKQNQDNKPVLSKLDDITKALNKQNTLMSQLISVAKSPKKVKYDGLGRIIEIKVEK